MPCATTRTVSLDGVAGHVVDVQADVTQGMVSTTLVGRPDAAVSESRDRCRVAMVNSGFEWPTTRRVTILLSPADLPKRGPHLDLAIAVAVLAADGKALDRSRVEDVVVIGELTLDGRLRAVAGVLPMVVAARAQGFTRVVVPEVHADEAAMVPGMEIYGVRSLQQAVAVLAGASVIPDAPPVEPLAVAGTVGAGGAAEEDLDLVDLHGMEDARFAIEVAAAGGHHVMLVGPKGAGKTSLAERIPGILPDLDVEQALELSTIHSFAGELHVAQGLRRRPPFRAPHHNASKASVLGGGTGRVRPGELSRALHGVLFLDEFPLFSRDLIDALRQPLESGEVTIARGEETATLPARMMLVIAANPCPCGDYHPDARESRCSCTESARRQYRARVSGPLADRIDIVRRLSPLRSYERHDPLAARETTAQVRSRVTAARRRQAERFAGTRWRLNSEVPGPVLTARWPLGHEADSLLAHEIHSGRLNGRGAVRVHRMAWTVADLQGRDSVGAAELGLALHLRLGDPLPLEAFERAEVVGS